MKKEYIKDAVFLIKDTVKKRKNITSLNNLQPSVIPTFRYIADGFTNFISGLGGERSKSIYTTYQSNYMMTDQILLSLWQGNGLSRKISSKICEDATRNDIIIENDSDYILYNDFLKLRALPLVTLADKYRRHFGGSIILLMVNDGGLLHEPLNLNRVKSFDGLKVYARTDLYFSVFHFTEDIYSPNYGQPEYYTIIPKYTNPFNIHYSRVIEMKGLEVPTMLDTGYRYYFGMSVIEPIWETFKKKGAALENVDQLLYELTLSIYKIKGYAQMINDKDWEGIKKIIQITDQSKSTIRSLLIDAEDDFKRDSLTFAGIKDVVELIMLCLSSETPYPFSFLFGKQSGGLNNEGDMEVRMYYDEVKSHQTLNLKPIVQKIVDIINIVHKKKIQDPDIYFNSPWQNTETQELQNRKLQMDIDEKLIDIGLVGERELREKRLSNGWSYDMTFDGELEEVLPEDDEVPPPNIIIANKKELEELNNEVEDDK